MVGLFGALAREQHRAQDAVDAEPRMESAEMRAVFPSTPVEDLADRGQQLPDADRLAVAALESSG